MNKSIERIVYDAKSEGNISSYHSLFKLITSGNNYIGNTRCSKINGIYKQLPGKEVI